MVSRRGSLAAILGFLAVAVGCSSTTQVACLGGVAIGVRVVDSLTGEPAAAGALLIAQHAGVTDTVRLAAGAAESVELATGNDAGTYDLSVSKPGYRVWTATHVDVAKGACGEPATVHLVARLQPAP